MNMVINNLKNELIKMNAPDLKAMAKSNYNINSGNESKKDLINEMLNIEIRNYYK